MWNKNNSCGFALADKRPFVVTENVSVFSKGSHNYYPQMEKRGQLRIKGGYSQSSAYGLKPSISISDTYYPKNVLEFSNAVQIHKQHPTQKPIALLQYLIRTYTNEGDTVLDGTCGSGSTIVAAQSINRKSIGIELDPGYCKIAASRLGKLEPDLIRKESEATGQTTIFDILTV